MRNAPHLVRNLAFVVPRYDWWEGPFYGVGLKIYDLLAGTSEPRPLADPRPRGDDRPRFPTSSSEGLRGGVMYHDGQFDDARLAVTLARTAADHGGAACSTTRGSPGSSRSDGDDRGVAVRGRRDGRAATIRARVVVNATGVFADELRRLDDPGAARDVRRARACTSCFDRAFPAGRRPRSWCRTRTTAACCSSIPWHGRVLVGTTDTPMPRAEIEPRPLPEEIEFLLRNAARYLGRDPSRRDVLCASPACARS